MARRDLFRWCGPLACAVLIGSAATAARAEPPGAPSSRLAPPPPPPPGTDPAGVPLGDAASLAPPPPPPAGVVAPPMCGVAPCGPESQAKQAKEARPAVEVRTDTDPAPEADRAARPEREVRPVKPAGRLVDGDAAPLGPGKLRPPSAIDPRPFELEPSERPRRNKGLLATGIVLTSVAPVAMVVSLFINTGGDQTGKNVGSVLAGILGTGTGIGMIVYGAHRLTPDEMEERRREERSGWLTPALAPQVSVGLGAIQASWTF